ncbi:MAG: cache domain-containing protein [Pygmaiobacter massiliensis]|nr:cache domain-containing protein [Pygmaiobacter massiliensis]
MVVILAVVLLAVGNWVVVYLRQSLEKTVHEQMVVETPEYQNRINKQIDKDFQTLHTLASVFSLDHIFDSDNLSGWIADANGEYNAFITMTYCTPDGVGGSNTNGSTETPTILLTDCNEYVQDAVSRSFLGESCISYFFESGLSDGKVYVYTVPVLENGQVVGVLAASAQLEIFEDIVNGHAVMGGSGYLHIINTQGDFLVRSIHSIVPDVGQSSIFDGPYIAKQEQDDILQVLASGESTFSEFTFEGKQYHFYLCPVGINNRYMMCVNTMWGTAEYLQQILYVAGGAFVLVLLLAIALLLFGYSMMRKSNRELLHLAYFDPVTGAENLT